jgi:hypothetical protein
MPLANTQIGATIRGDYSPASLDLQVALATLSLNAGVSLTTGTGSGQADKIWADTRTLTASSSEDLDLVGTALTDAFGVAFSVLRVKGLLVAADSTNVNNVVVGANVANGWATLFGPTGASGGTVTVRPGGFFCAGCTDATGWATTAGTGDLLHIANGGAGTSVIYSIVIIGSSA